MAAAAKAKTRFGRLLWKVGASGEAKSAGIELGLAGDAPEHMCGGGGGAQFGATLRGGDPNGANEGAKR